MFWAPSTKSVVTGHWTLQIRGTKSHLPDFVSRSKFAVYCWPPLCRCLHRASAPSGFK